MHNAKTTVGRNVLVDLAGHATQIPAKVDTGADSSSIWASGIEILADGTLQFMLFHPSSPFYSGQKVRTSQYTVAKVRSATGHEEIRYQVRLPLRLKGRNIKANFNLSNRSSNYFPILIGRRTLNGKFIVDVSMADVEGIPVIGTKERLNQELSEDPVAFHNKYHA